ncbi:hypothetical protein BS17DRAFT_183647 [Gyrodon lividus]|nr:hypothetical protein BS17DRAFT_183647 [Gyrodon lividus]
MPHSSKLMCFRHTLPSNPFFGYSLSTCTVMTAKKKPNTWQASFAQGRCEAALHRMVVLFRERVIVNERVMETLCPPLIIG